jgi:DNA-binding IclR family transcriptional regulator
MLNRAFGIPNNALPAPAVARAFELLERVAHAASPPSLSELALTCGIGKSSAHGLLATLVAVGALQRDAPTKRYRLGPRARALSGNLRPDALELAQAALPELASALGETVFVGRERGDTIEIRAQAGSPHELRLVATHGTRLSVLAGATGKVVLARRAPAERARLLRLHGLRRYTTRSITSQTRYHAELERVAAQGVAFDRGEYLEGIHAVAVPLPGEALLWVAGPSKRMDARRMRAAAARLRRLAAQIARQVS